MRSLEAAKMERSEADAAAEYRRLTEPAAGRSAVVSAAALLANPEKFSGKRVIISGILRHSFEGSWLDLEHPAQAFSISLSFDWQKIDEPMGDLSRRKASDEPGGMPPVRIVAEGTFHFRAPESPSTQPRYVLMSGPGYFIVDRLFRYEPLKEAPNQ